MISLGEDGLAKVKSGITTPEELIRVVTEVREMRTLCARVRVGGRRRFQCMPVLRQAAGRRMSALRPRPATGLELLSLLREEHVRRETGQAQAPARRSAGREGPRELPAANVAEFKK